MFLSGEFTKATEYSESTRQQNVNPRSGGNCLLWSCQIGLRTFLEQNCKIVLSKNSCILYGYRLLTLYQQSWLNEQNARQIWPDNNERAKAMEDAAYLFNNYGHGGRLVLLEHR